MPFTVTFGFDNATQEEAFYDAFIAKNQPAFFAFLGAENPGDIFSLPPVTLTDKKEFMEQAAAETYRVNFLNLVDEAALELARKNLRDTSGATIVVEDKTRARIRP